MFTEFDKIVGLSFNQISHIAFKNQKSLNNKANAINHWLEGAQKKRRSRVFQIFEADLVDKRWFLMSEQVLPSGELLLQAKNITKQKIVE